MLTEFSVVRELGRPMAEHRIQIVVVVNGQPTLVEANLHSPLETIIPRALEQTGNTGQPPENWELRDAQGTLLDTSKEIASFDFPPDVHLFLNLKAGVGGSA
jgi:hypothetical protein